MKNIFKSFVIMLITAFVLTACGGSSSDSGPGAAPAGTFTKEVAFVSLLGVNAHFFGDNDYRHFQLLYKPADVAGSGYIKSIFFKRNTTLTTATTCPQVTIKLGHTSVDGLNTNMTLNINQGKGSAVTVLDNVTFTIPAGNAGDYFEIPLSVQFNYNGVDNLVVDVTRTAACSQDLEVICGQDTSTYTAYVFSPTLGSPDTAIATSLNVLHVKFAFAGGDNKVDLSSGSILSTAPFNTNSNYNKVQMLYKNSAIAGSGIITGIGLQVSAVTDAQQFTYTMKIGHSTRNNLDTTWADNFDAGSPVVVANSVVLHVPAGVPAGEFIWLPIPDGVFTYNGTDNLLIEITVNDNSSATDSVSLALHSTANINYLYGSPTDAEASNWSSYSYQIALRFYGGTMDVIDKGVDETVVFGSSAGGKQFLLRAAELGTSGYINKLAFRLVVDSKEESYPDFTVTLAHTTQDVLAATDATNIAGGITVYSNTYSIPDGIEGGDWVEIPLTTPFNFNGTDNLVVQASTSGSGGDVNNCLMTWGAAQYVGLYKNTGGSSPINYRGMFKFWVNK